MNKEELVEQMLTEKGNSNNSIDLDAYAMGLIDMHEKLVKNNIVLPDVSGQLPDFLYEDEGEIKIGYHGDTVVTDEWNKWKEGNLR